MRCITEEHYAETMRTQVEPFLDARRETGFDERIAGQPIYYEHYRADAPKGVVVISHGFTESVRKFGESIYYLLQAGYEVWGVDHRGHGRSYRANSNPYVVYVDRFEDYVEDLRHLTETLVKPAAGALPVYLFCHSMGGCIGAWIMEEYPELFDKAVLSSPMLGLSFGKIPLPVAYAVASLKSRGEKGKEPLSPVEGFREESFPESAGNSQVRFDYYYAKRLADPKLQVCAPATRWGKEAIRACRMVCDASRAGKIRIPVLLLQAEKDAHVKNSSQDLFASRVKTCRLVKLPDLRHELYVSDSPVLQNYWDTIFAFLES